MHIKSQKYNFACFQSVKIHFVVQTVFSRGAAGADGRLKRGDQILAVNAESFEGFTHDEAVQALKRAKGTVVLTIAS